MILRSWKLALILAVGLALCFAAVGCKSSQSSRSEVVQRSHQPRAALVMPSPRVFDYEDSAEIGSLSDAATDPWVYSRNDLNMGTQGGSRLMEVQAVRVWHREHLRVLNGRTRDFTTTRTDSVKWGVTR